MKLYGHDEQYNGVLIRHLLKETFSNYKVFGDTHGIIEEFLELDTFIKLQRKYNINTEHTSFYKQVNAIVIQFYYDNPAMLEVEGFTLADIYYDDVLKDTIKDVEEWAHKKAKENEWKKI